MMRSTMLLGLLVIVALLAGCVGTTSDPVEPQNAAEQGPTSAGLDDQTIVYRASGEEPISGDELDEFAPWAGPPPVGLARYIDHANQETFEPTIGVTSQGTLFVSNYGFGDDPAETVQEFSSILRSTDKGETWTDVSGEIGPISSPPQSNDPFVYVDRGTDRVFDLHMQGLQCNWLRWSDDGGDTWSHNPNACGQPPSIQDRPNLFTGPPGPETLATDQATLEAGPYGNVVYICANRVVAETACTRSLDGGWTWSPWRELVTGLESRNDSCASGSTHHGTTGPDGTAYLPSVINLAEGCEGPADPVVAVSQDSGLTWVTGVISEKLPSKDNNVAIAVDDEGTVFAFWIGPEFGLHLSASTDEGASWRDPIQVGPPEVELADFPALAATGDGSVAAAYIGTTTDAPTLTDVPSDTAWHAYITTIPNATNEDPIVFTTTANHRDDPIARGECNAENRCYSEEGNAGLGDFIDIVIDDDGRPWAAFVDACTQECIEDPSAGKDVAVGFVGTLNEGPSLDDPTTALEPLVTPDKLTG